MTEVPLSFRASIGFQRLSVDMVCVCVCVCVYVDVYICVFVCVCSCVCFLLLLLDISDCFTYRKQTSFSAINLVFRRPCLWK